MGRTQHVLFCTPLSAIHLLLKQTVLNYSFNRSISQTLIFGNWSHRTKTLLAHSFCVARHKGATPKCYTCVSSGNSKGRRREGGSPGQKICDFHAVFVKNWSNSMLASPSGVGAPPLGIWIHHWSTNYDYDTFVFQSLWRLASKN